MPLAVVSAITALMVLAGCTSQPAVPVQLTNLLASRSIAKTAAKYCPTLNRQTSILAAGNSTVAELRSLTFSTSAMKSELTRTIAQSAGSTYAAICIFSTKHEPSFKSGGPYIAWWRLKDGSDGVIANW